jgi:hypothetical protein
MLKIPLFSRCDNANPKKYIAPTTKGVLIRQMSDFTSYSEQDLVGKQWIHWSNEQKLVNCTHIL